MRSLTRSSFGLGAPIHLLLCAVLIAVGLTAPAGANPVLLSPTGTTLTTGQFRAEAAFSPGNDHGSYYWLAAGLQQLELNAVRIENRSGKDESIVGLQWSFLPETFVTPAVSFGVKDIAAESAEGVGVYAAVTRHLPVGELSPILKELAVTAGVGAGGIRGPFFSFEAKLPWKLFAQGEYDSRDFNAAVGWQPVRIFRIKAYKIRRESFLGAEIVPITF